MVYSAIIYYLIKKKNPQISYFEFGYFTRFLYRNLLVKDINTVKKWSPPSSPLKLSTDYVRTKDLVQKL